MTTMERAERRAMHSSRGHAFSIELRRVEDLVMWNIHGHRPEVRIDAACAAASRLPRERRLDGISAGEAP